MTILFTITFGSDRMKIVGGVYFEIFAPIGSHVNGNEKKNVKNWKLKILKKEKKCSGDMVERELSIIFDLDPYSSFRVTWINGRRTDGRRTCMTTVALLDWQSQAEPKMSTPTKSLPRLIKHFLLYLELVRSEFIKKKSVAKWSKVR